MDGRRKMVVIVRLVLVLFAASLNIQIADGRRSLETQNPGFISIDCGVDEDYLDSTTGLYYKSDKNFVSTGKNQDILAEYDEINNRIYSSLRYFPEGRKNCYTLKPDQGKNHNYLIRAFFSYGNYDGKNQTPKFDLYLGVHYWVTIEFDSINDFFYYTISHFSLTDLISVCLINTDFGIPLIAALELRPVNNSIYRTDSGFAGIYETYDAGYPQDNSARYKDDIYDRIWKGYMSDDWVLVNTAQNLQIQSDGDSYKIPPEVLRTAVQPRDNVTSLTFSKDFSYKWSYYNVYFYFAEVQRIREGLKREFTITLNGVLYGPYTPQYLKPLTVVCEKVESLEGVIRFSINSTVQLPPILSGFEILANDIDLHNTSATNSIDVGAVTAIKQIYNLDRPDWQGDPCVPRDFPWNGLNCTTYNNTPRIVSVNFGSSALSGEIASEFSNLQALQSLDLSSNELIGKVPEFLAELPNLVNLNLSGNQLTGPLPQLLIEKSKNGTLNLSFDQKPNGASTGSSETNKRNFLIPVTVSIISLLVLLNLVILAICWRVKRHVIGSGNPSLLISKNRSFTYSEIVNMTNNFRNIIGEGGFGKVYHGELNDVTQVAVKLLSQSSKQGFKEFLSEVQLLIMVYHRNLVSLIGYCDDDGNMALVYEYMENGNLKEHLSDKSSYVLNWRERLHIALDAAQGLEYLHNGCKPPIIHRDLKTANILLNENLVAKISDFGLSRVFATDKDTHVSTNPAGTFGYVDPEFYVTGNLNKKSDVYSFGIILLELITGRPVVVRGEDYSTYILQWITPMIEEGDIRSIVDQKLEGEFNTNSAWNAMEIAMSCVKTSAVERPDMGHVLVALKECLAMDMASGRTQRTRSNMSRSITEYEVSSFDVDTLLNVNPTVR